MKSHNRRTFLKHAAKATALSLLPTVPISAKSYRRILGANERIHIGAIGCGSMGSAHLRALTEMKTRDNVEVIQVCDVYDKRKEQAAQLTNGKGERYYQQLLDNKELDYVLIATPEHWHHKMAMDSLDAGKHVYCEKPMTHEIKQAFEVWDKVNETGLHMQVGVQGMSDDSYLTARSYIKDGVLGKVTMAQIDYSRNGSMWMYDIDPDADPSTNLDWELWQGPSPKVPWDPDRYFRWRRYWDYSGGIATDLFIHRLSRLIKAVDLKFPEYVTASGGHYFFKGEDRAEVPDTFNMMIDYPEGPTVMLVSAQTNDTRIKHMIRGRKATLEFTSEGFTITPQEKIQSELIQDSGEELPTDEEGMFHHTKTGAEDITLHHRNLQHAIRKGESLHCDAELGLYGMLACKMGVMSFRERKYYRWDSRRNRAVST